MSVDSFIKLLHAAEAFPETFNPWRDEDSGRECFVGAAKVRSENLRCWMNQLRPKIILLGEAPSHHGAKFSGIPFTDPLMFEERALTAFAGLNLRNTAKEPEREMSGRAVWEIIEPEWRSVCLWNAFAFHPHLPGDMMSNRAPKRSEIEGAKMILLSLMELYPEAMMIPVGGKAAETLKRLGVEYRIALRHPAFGGRKIFQQGLRELLSDININGV